MKSWNLAYLHIGLLLLLLMGLAAGCIYISRPTSTPAGPVPPVSGQRPMIHSFLANPGSIEKGQAVALSWGVSGADAINIQPYVGSVDSYGSKLLNLESSITFTLTATNSAGSSTSTVTVTVSLTPGAGGADLKVVDVWLEGEVIYYRVMNAGLAESAGGITRLYFGGLEQSKDYLEPVPAGAVKSGAFYLYKSGPLNMMILPPGFWVTVCVDVEDSTKESNERNNCLDKVIVPAY